MRIEPENLIPTETVSSPKDEHFHIHWHGMDGVRWPDEMLDDKQVTIKQCGQDEVKTRWNRPHIDYDNADDDGYPDGIDTDWTIYSYICGHPMGNQPEVHVKGYARGRIAWKWANRVKINDKNVNNDWMCDDSAKECHSDTDKLLDIWLREDVHYHPSAVDMKYKSPRFMCDSGYMLTAADAVEDLNCAKSGPATPQINRTVLPSPSLGSPPASFPLRSSP